MTLAFRLCQLYVCVPCTYMYAHVTCDLHGYGRAECTVCSVNSRWFFVMSLAVPDKIWC